MPPTARKAAAPAAPETALEASPEPEETAAGIDATPDDPEAAEEAPEAPTVDHLAQLCPFCGVHPVEGHTSFTCEHGSWKLDGGQWVQV